MSTDKELAEKVRQDFESLPYDYKEYIVNINGDEYRITGDNLKMEKIDHDAEAERSKKAIAEIKEMIAHTKVRLREEPKEFTLEVPAEFETGIPEIYAHPALVGREERFFWHMVSKYGPKWIVETDETGDKWVAAVRAHHPMKPTEMTYMEVVELFYEWEMSDPDVLISEKDLARYHYEKDYMGYRGKLSL